MSAPSAPSRKGHKLEGQETSPDCPLATGTNCASSGFEPFRCHDLVGHQLHVPTQHPLPPWLAADVLLPFAKTVTVVIEP